MTSRSWLSRFSWFPINPWNPRGSWRTYIPSGAWDSWLPIGPSQALQSDYSYWPRGPIEPWGPIVPLSPNGSHTRQPRVTPHTLWAPGSCEPDDAHLSLLSYRSGSSRKTGSNGTNWTGYTIEANVTFGS